MLEFAIHLGQRFLAAHCQNRVSEADEDPDSATACGMLLKRSQPAPLEQTSDLPLSAMAADERPAPKRSGAPGNHHDHHHGSYIHDPQRFPAGLRNPLDVLPPEINRHRNGKHRRRGIDRKRKIDVRTGEQIVQESVRYWPAETPLMARSGCSQHQRGNGKFRERAAHRFFNHPVNTAAHKYAAALDIHGPHGVREHMMARITRARALPMACSAIAPA